TTSLPILPQRAPTSRLSQPPHPPLRPKLSLNTQQTRLFGKQASLRLETLSAVSPTVRNTFSNAYEAPVSAVPALGRPSKPRLSIDSSVPVSGLGQAASGAATALQIDTSTPNSSVPNSASTLNSGSTSASSTDSATIKVPYKLSHNLPSILSNSPAQSIRPRKMAPYRPFFPATKKVSFRTPLEEEITTSTYTLAHSDIEHASSSTLSIESSSTSSSSSSEASTSSTQSTESKSEAESLSHSPSTLSLSVSSSEPSATPSPAPSSPVSQSSSPAFSSTDSPPRLRGPRTGDKRDSSSSEDSDSEDSCPETPVAGRRKRRREWVWTLGPIGNGSKFSSSSD
ncbi:hypothetical protein BU16DRAFT_424753, partial [Lophium mytilinum]